MLSPVEANQTKSHMIRSDTLNYLWNPVSIFQEATISPGNSKLEKTITLSKVKMKLSFKNKYVFTKLILFRMVKSLQSIQAKTNTMRDFMWGFL